MDGKGNPIPPDCSLGIHVSQMDPHDYWNSIKTRNKVHPYIPQANKAGPSNSTAFGPNVHPMSNPNNPIVEHHIDMDTSADPALTTVKELYKDENIPPGFVIRALNAAVSFLSQARQYSLLMIVHGICNRCQHHINLVQGIPTRHQHLYRETPDMDPDVYHYPNPLLIVPQVHTRVWHKLQIVVPPPHKRCQQQILSLTQTQVVETRS